MDGDGLASEALRVVALPLSLLIASPLLLGGCSSASTDEPNSEPTIASLDAPDEMCLHGARRTPRSNINVDRATVVPLARVKRWVLEVPERDWATFSASLVDAPPTERVAICVLTKKDGSGFKPEGSPESYESLVTITRANGESTVVNLSTLEDNLDSTPTTFARYGND
ncbi:hypothetical protein [Nocardioides aurantiacus]|uniref:Uncharacterized protein n=1 Tax=Nocardioides aurantiacus TaxID=86796 RepID=A0A3N2CUQ5_9ACTN|nr:hypothetical protein [Nocardioides aurantiacus]ROR90954.1 hypothetical protein EDD33_1811 [Nocardioides aurantiacus]